MGRHVLRPALKHWLHRQSSNDSYLHLTATTTGAAQTVTLKQITPTGGTLLVDWGDGGTTSVADGYAGTVTHQYASAGAYPIVVRGAQRITTLDLQDAKLGGLNTNQLRRARLETFYLSGLDSATITLDSADMTGWGVSTQFYLYNLPSASITLDSADMAGWGVSTQFYLSGLASATITLDSADMVGWGVSYGLTLFSIPSAVVTLDSADMVGWGVSNAFYLSGLTSANITLSAADMLAWNSPDEIHINNCGLTAANVTQAILGAWGLRNLMGHSTPVLNIGGASNAVPGGAYADEDPPTTDLGYIYELVNDPESEGFYKWAVTWNGGSAP